MSPKSVADWAAVCSAIGCTVIADTTAHCCSNCTAVSFADWSAKFDPFWGPVCRTVGPTVYRAIRNTHWSSILLPFDLSLWTADGSAQR